MGMPCLPAISSFIRPDPITPCLKSEIAILIRQRIVAENGLHFRYPGRNVNLRWPAIEIKRHNDAIARGLAPEDKNGLSRARFDELYCGGVNAPPEGQVVSFQVVQRGV